MDIAKETMLGPYRVLDLTDEIGNYCARMLGDMGAEVIKIEKPGGDAGRDIGPFYNNEADPEKSLYWFFNCMNKKSITLNIEETEGRDIFKRLVKKADFVIESFQPGYMAKLGLGYEDLEKINPRIIMASITPFGQKGPYSDYKMTDLTSWAVSGAMHLTGDTDRAPLQCTIPQAYLQAGATAATGVLLAHHHREMSGLGQHVDVSVQESMAYVLTEGPTRWEFTKEEKTRAGTGMELLSPKGLIRIRFLYPCKDGYIYFSAPGPKVMMTSNMAWTEWMESEGLNLDRLKAFGWPLFDFMELTPEDINAIDTTIGNFVKNYTKAELYEEGLKRNITLVPVSSLRDLLENEQLKDREFFVEMEHEDLKDSITYPGYWAKLQGPSWPKWHIAPHIGEHNLEIYVDEMGIDEAQVSALKKKNII